jgi:hypothetical protein
MKELVQKSHAGFYSVTFQTGKAEILKLLKQPIFSTDLSGLREDFMRTLLTDFHSGGVAQFKVGDLSVRVSSDIRPVIDRLATHAKSTVDEINRSRDMIKRNFSGEELNMPEDSPLSATEKPSITQIRGDLDKAVLKARETWGSIASQALNKWGIAPSGKSNILVFGIGANDMYLKALEKAINSDPAKKASLYVATGPSDYLSLPPTLTGDNTLVIGISRSGTTQDTLKALEYNRRDGRFKHVVVFANKNDIKDLAGKQDFITAELPENIGGRYMREKGLIVLVPMLAAASDKFFNDYTDAMVKFDREYFPVGENGDVFDLAANMYYFLRTYNIPMITAVSNNPVLEAGLREPIQLYNEAVGKISNQTLMVRPGLELAPFAHAGIEGFMEMAWNGGLYGLFVMDTSIRNGYEALPESAVMNPKHAGLGLDEINTAFSMPNWAKFDIVGGPNILITMDGVTPERMSTLTSIYVNTIWPLLLMMDCNQSSNPQVAEVRKGTGAILSALRSGGTGDDPAGFIREVVAKQIRGV